MHRCGVHRRIAAGVALSAAYPFVTTPAFLEGGEARRGVARRGEARRGVACRGVAWRGVAWRGVAWRGEARRGVAWRGEAMSRCGALLRSAVCAAARPLERREHHRLLR